LTAPARSDGSLLGAGQLLRRLTPQVHETNVCHRDSRINGRFWMTERAGVWVDEGEIS
jgi:hypothetical protein